VLHHGPVLFAVDSGLAERYQRDPPRQPAYRAGRGHGPFMGNLPLSREIVKRRVMAALATIGDSSRGDCAGPDHVHNDAHVPNR
jgi:hypothetical protein